jgi:hypothetical protein
MQLVKVVATVAVVAFSTVASADEWSLTAEHKYSQSASIRVVEPEGYKVTVGDSADTVPAVFNLKNADAYQVVKLTAPDGKTWEKKVEVRANHQTIVRVKHAAAAAPKEEPAKKTKSHIGTVKNTTNKCDRRSAHKFDFMLDGTLVKSFELEAGKYIPNVELAPGSYDVRRFSVKSNQWVFDETTTFAVSKDGWVYYYGCQ